MLNSDISNHKKSLYMKLKIIPYNNGSRCLSTRKDRTYTCKKYFPRVQRKLGEKSTAENYGVSSEPCPFTKF